MYRDGESKSGAQRTTSTTSNSDTPQAQPGPGGPGQDPPSLPQPGDTPRQRWAERGGLAMGAPPQPPPGLVLGWGVGVGSPPPFCFFFVILAVLGVFLCGFFFVFLFSANTGTGGEERGGGQACGRVLRGRSSGCRLGSHRRLRQAGTRTATVSSSFTAAGRPGPPSRGSGRSATCRRGGATRGSPRTGWCEAGPGRRCTA